jgi:hypothetical protein
MRYKHSGLKKPNDIIAWQWFQYPGSFTSYNPPHIKFQFGATSNLSIVFAQLIPLK